MTCNRVQAELSEAMDGEGGLSSETARHLSTCFDCSDFRSTSIEMCRRYATEVHAGIDRLRRLEGPVLPRKPRRRPVQLLIPLAAACLLCWCGMGKPKIEATRAPAPVIAMKKAAPSQPASRVRLFEDPVLLPGGGGEITFVFEREPLLPLRLDQDLLPVRSDLSEINLPPSLRF